MTQALALAGFLRSAGHEVTRVLIGTSPFRSLPSYFREGIGAPLETFDAPTLVPDRHGRGASAAATTADIVRRLPSFLRSISRIRSAAAQGDVVVNFLDLMGGLARALPGPSTPSLAVAHNYVFLGDGLVGLPGPGLTRAAVLTYVRATAIGSESRVALSFDSPSDVRPGGPIAAPPLLRPTLQTLPVERGDFLLAYALNAGYGELLADWQRRHPDAEVHCYVDGGADALRTPPGPGFHAHDLDDTAFLGHLAGCRAYVGSAGFESICEAFYLGKPVLAVPTAGHYEQVLNGWDAERVGAARVGSYDDLDDFWADPPVPSETAVRDFRSWVARAPEVMVDLVERTAQRRR
jgi:hypothetical protein